MHCLGLDSEGQHCRKGSVLIKLLKDSLDKNKFLDPNKVHVLLVQEGPVCNGSSTDGFLCLPVSGDGCP